MGKFIKIMPYTTINNLIFMRTNYGYSKNNRLMSEKLMRSLEIYKTFTIEKQEKNRKLTLKKVHLSIETEKKAKLNEMLSPANLQQITKKQTYQTVDVV